MGAEADLSTAASADYTFVTHRLAPAEGWAQASAADDEAAQWTDARGTPAQWMDHAIC